jgi:hypothetical protein
VGSVPAAHSFDALSLVALPSAARSRLHNDSNQMTRGRALRLAATNYEWCRLGRKRNITVQTSLKAGGRANEPLDEVFVGASSPLIHE